MIFSKDDDDQLPYTKSDKLLLIKTFICSIFLFFSVFFILLNKETPIGLIVLCFGIVWNMLLPLNNWFSLVMSVLMGFIYAVVCIPLGLYANAFLYIAYYVPMQYMAINLDGDTYILKNKSFSKIESLVFLGYYVLFFISLYFVSSQTNAPLICLFDALSATVLAVSALARNFRVAIYYKIRFSALIVSIVLWTLFATSSTVYAGAKSIALMYLMYLVVELCQYIYEKKHYTTVSIELSKKEKQNQKHNLAQKKKEEYSKNA